MPRARMDDELSKFYDWMVGSGFSPATAKVYTSACRSMKRKLGDEYTDMDMAKPFLLELKETQPKVYATYVSAHNCVNRYFACKGEISPSAKHSKELVVKETQKFPITVQLAIKVIENYNKKAEKKVSLAY